MTKTLMLISFGIGTISKASGMEKVFVDMANAFVNKGYRVIAVVNDTPGAKFFYKFSVNVEYFNLGLGKIKVPISKKINREISKMFGLNLTNPVDRYRTEIYSDCVQQILSGHKIVPDYVVCYEFNSVMVATKLFEHTPKVAMLHSNVSSLLGKMSPKQLAIANKMDAYQVLSKSFVQEAKQYLDTQIVYIPNAIQIKENTVDKRRLVKKDRYTIINVGRLDKHTKRQHILVEAFSKLSEIHKNWDLAFYGDEWDKDYKDNMLTLIQQNHLEERVKFYGAVNNIDSILREADLFAFPSGIEGFGLALAEAMAAELPAVGFKNTDGVNELIIDGETGILCDDGVEAFSAALNTLMENEELRFVMGHKAREAVKKYEAQNIWNKWEKLLLNLR